MSKSLSSASLLTLILLFMGACTLMEAQTQEVAQIKTSVKIGSSHSKPMEIQLDGQKTVTFWADAAPANVAFEWQLTGSGKLIGKKTDPSIQYMTPPSVNGEEEILVTITVTNQKNHQKASDHIAIKLLPAAPSTAAPGNTPTSPHTSKGAPPVCTGLLYEGAVLRVCQTEAEIVIENISDNSVAIRVSWDGQDPRGIGDCPQDCFIVDLVGAGKQISGKIKNHSSVQVWAWGADTSLIDSADLIINNQRQN